ncbi:unnamed protein product [Rangifer tarandus platyrhynchus]|uniref:Uncharacterized protein n=1 Tax=Rangifer tarandus platyrhynchus TaxID=3082113 RepID=A0ABN9A6C7_RANTA|nr:unnamed protein product [Rangifer tarandus platyrhynchus]
MEPLSARSLHPPLDQYCSLRPPGRAPPPFVVRDAAGAPNLPPSPRPPRSLCPARGGPHLPDTLPPLPDSPSPPSLTSPAA